MSPWSPWLQLERMATVASGPRCQEKRQRGRNDTREDRGKTKQLLKKPCPSTLSHLQEMSLGLSERPGNYLSSFTETVPISTTVQCGCLCGTTPAMDSETRRPRLEVTKALSRLSHFLCTSKYFLRILIVSSSGEKTRTGGRLID